jgi:flagellar motor switch protein FliM
MPAACAPPSARARIIHPCNFRYAGRLSNENARFLTALHEKFAINITTALELYLGASLRLTLVSLEQLAIQDYVAALAPKNYILPCALDVMDSNCLIEVDLALICPIIDLLLGGTGQSTSVPHELTDVDEQIVESVSSLVVKELERCWGALNLSLSPGRCVKPGMIQQIFPVNEKLVLLMFEMTLGGSTGAFNIVLPSPFVGYLLRNMKASQSKKSSLRLHRPGLRERILDCNFVVSADIVHMRVEVKNLIDIQPGMILKTNALVKDPGRLTVDGVEIFEALPVRMGRMKAAQLTHRCQEPEFAKE